jgi:hypothetical protein
MSRLEQTSTSTTTPTITAVSLANERKLADKQRRNAGREVKTNKHHPVPPRSR